MQREGAKRGSDRPVARRARRGLLGAEQRRLCRHGQPVAIERDLAHLVRDVAVREPRRSPVAELVDVDPAEHFWVALAVPQQDVHALELLGAVGRRHDDRPFGHAPHAIGEPRGGGRVGERADRREIGGRAPERRRRRRAGRRHERFDLARSASGRRRSRRVARER